ncbi:PLP-dependent transferase [Panus rudis PR-1116 ss-1]|nr:PLP-dependent transferase [Panus rudis PR-1116 ss-1]
MSALRFRISKGIEATSTPPIPQAYGWGESYKPTPGRPLLDMSQGVPGVPPPPKFLEALGSAASSPKTCGYVPNAGEQILRKVIAEEMKVPYGESIDVTEEDIAITAGCNMAFAASIMTIAEKGDEVILPVPWYFNHEMTLTMLGIKAVPLPTDPDNGFLPSVDSCTQLITQKTKAIVLVTPNNPTGAIYPPSLLAAYANLARSKNIALILDETYRDFLLPESLPPHRLFERIPSDSTLPSDWSWRETVIHLFSFSKSYCIPGHRVGLVCASPDLIPALNKALDNMQICAPRPPQVALANTIPSLRPFVNENAEALQHRHQLFAQKLPPHWKIGAQGGYYAFVKHPFVGVNATRVAQRLAEEMGVLSLPAGFFYPTRTPENEVVVNGKHPEDRWIRFSVANVDDDKVIHVCERLKESESCFSEWKVEV